MASSIEGKDRVERRMIILEMINSEGIEAYTTSPALEMLAEPEKIAAEAFSKGLPLLVHLGPGIVRADKVAELASRVARSLGAEKHFTANDARKAVEEVLRAKATPLNPPVDEVLYDSAELVVQAVARRIAKSISQEVLDVWFRPECPVCGRLSGVAVKEKEQPWRFRCTFCTALHAFDMFTCPFCGETGGSVNIYVIDGEPQYEIVYCEKCKRYYKLIFLDLCKEPIPEGMEDHLTLHLDLIAKDKGLRRVDEA